MKVWVLRRGVSAESNPLRPLTRTPLVVLQIFVNGRHGLAAGPDGAHLRRVAGLAEIEGAAGEPVSWIREETAPLPTLRIVSDDGRVVVNRLVFVSCEAAPAALPAAAAERPGPRRAADGPSGRSGPPSSRRAGPALPQGAIESPTLNLQGGRP